MGMLFGMETELAFAAWRREDGAPANTSRLLRELYFLADKRLVSLPEATGVGMFLSNGARFYLDRGNHPEMCTPECQSPAEVVRWQLACEQHLADLVAELEKGFPDSQAALFRCNVDYSGSGVTWGCHESYQHRRSHQEMAPQLIPHLVTRLVYTGAGGFTNKTDKLQFLISPRVPHLVHEVIHDTPERGIYDTRHEPLSRGGFDRLHVICGESLCSELSNYLKLGTTALVVRLVDAGVCSGHKLALVNPVKAMQSLARDPSARVRVELADGQRLTAIEIQAEYLAMVEQHLGADFMPEWAPEVCHRWRRVLEQLETDPTSLGTSLDWAIKLALFRDRMDRAGVGADTLRRAGGLGAELCEIDTRFGELSERALFHALDEAGALAHRIPERGAIEDAMLDAPPGARAEARGCAIRALHTERDRYPCSWDLIRDLKQPRVLDLGDPFAATVQWSAAPIEPSWPRNDPGSVLRRHLDRGVAACNAQDLEQAIAVLHPVILEAAQAPDRDREAVARFWCSSAHHDGGDLDAAESVLAPALADTTGVSPGTQILISTRNALIQIERPAPLFEIVRALDAALATFKRAQVGRGRSRITLLEARVLGARGRHAEAVRAAERAWTEVPFDPSNFSEASHLRWLLTFLLRAGLFRRALTHLDTWRERVARHEQASYSGVSLAIAESALALRLGLHAESLQHASNALERSCGFPRHRSRLAACIAFLESAAASAELERTDEILEELRLWRDVQVGELRFEMLRAEALVHLVRARGESAPTAKERARRSSGGAARPSFDEAYRAARKAAEVLDKQLECERHVGELDERIPDPSFVC